MENKSRMKVWVININTYCLFIAICLISVMLESFSYTPLLRGERRSLNRRPNAAVCVLGTLVGVVGGGVCVRSLNSLR